jgi:hypothetical protein
MSLPKWVEEVSKEKGTNRADFTPRLINAISIMWDVLESIMDLETDSSSAVEACQGEAEEAMRQVEDLGEKL